MGGIRTDTPPTVTVAPWKPAHAVIEGDTSSPDGEEMSPSYTDMLVTPPDTTDTVTVSAGIAGAVGSDM